MRRRFEGRPHRISPEQRQGLKDVLRRSADYTPDGMRIGSNGEVRAYKDADKILKRDPVLYLVGYVADIIDQKGQPHPGW